MIDRDTPCRACGYNLRGLADAGRCPECGRPVAESLESAELRHSDPAWLRGMATGLTILLRATAVNLVVAVLMLFVPSELGLDALGSAVNLLAGAVALYGAWLLTAPEPGDSGRDAAPQVARVALIVALVGTLITLLGHVSGDAISLLIFGGAAELAEVVGQVALLLHLRRLAVRVPNYPAAARARFLMVALPTGCFCFLAFGLIGLWATAAGAADGVLIALLVLILAAGVATLAIAVMALVLLATVRRLLRGQAKQAEHDRRPARQDGAA